MILEKSLKKSHWLIFKKFLFSPSKNRNKIIQTLLKISPFKNSLTLWSVPNLSLKSLFKIHEHFSWTFQTSPVTHTHIYAYEYVNVYTFTTGLPATDSFLNLWIKLWQKNVFHSFGHFGVNGRSDGQTFICSWCKRWAYADYFVCLFLAAQN